MSGVCCAVCGGDILIGPALCAGCYNKSTPRKFLQQIMNAPSIKEMVESVMAAREAFAGMDDILFGPKKVEPIYVCQNCGIKMTAEEVVKHQCAKKVPKPVAWIATAPSGAVMHLARADGWKVEVVLEEEKRDGRGEA